MVHVRVSRARILGAAMWCFVGCGDDGESPKAGADGGGDQQTGDAATMLPSDASLTADSNVDTSENDAGNVQADATTGEGLDAKGFPILPASAKDLIMVSVSNSDSTLMPNGLYQAPYAANASSGNSLSFLDTSFIFTQMPSLQVQTNLKRAMMSGSFSCGAVTDFLMRFGEPPSGSNQVVSKSCEAEYSYDASSMTYTGTIKAEMSEGLTEPGAETTLTASARFTVGGPK